MTDTNGLILATVAVTGATTFVRQVSDGDVEFRSYLGASLMGIFLTGIAMVNETLARNFCVLIILAVMLKNGGKFFDFAAKASTGKEAK